MNAGKTLFAQLMDFLPWSMFARTVERYDDDRRVRTLSCGEPYRAMAFAQPTYRESLRDIEASLSVHASKLYHMRFRQAVRRSTRADANEGRDGRIYAEMAQRLTAQARKLYANEDLCLDLTDTVYALDATTIDLCLSVFPWAHFRTTMAAVKMHTRLDLRSSISSFIHISDGKGTPQWFRQRFATADEGEGDDALMLLVKLWKPSLVNLLQKRVNTRMVTRVLPVGVGVTHKIFGKAVNSSLTVKGKP
jgi:hypothetical protein